MSDACLLCGTWEKVSFCNGCLSFEPLNRELVQLNLKRGIRPALVWLTARVIQFDGTQNTPQPQPSVLLPFTKSSAPPRVIYLFIYWCECCWNFKLKLLSESTWRFVTFCLFRFDSFLQIIAPSGTLITRYPVCVCACWELVQFWKGSCIDSEVLKRME